MMMMMMTSKVANNPSVAETRNRTSRTSPTKSPQSDDGEQTNRVIKKRTTTKTKREEATSPNKHDNSRQSSCSPVQQADKSASDETESASPNKNNANSNCKYNTQQCQSLRQKEKEMEKLRKDLEKCQHELREEIAKRGSSSSARAASDRDRARLLNEIKELGVSKRRLESALEEASSALKKKTQEVKLVREACKQEVAALEKSANFETKKLLDDLKAKDHLLAVLDRNQYSDRSNQIKLLQRQQQQQDKLNSPTPDDSFSSVRSSSPEQQRLNKHPRKGEGTIQEEISGLKTKIADLERQLHTASLEHGDLEKQNKDILATKHNLEATITKLRDDNMQLNSDLNAVQFEVKRLNESLSNSNVEEMIDQFERLKSTTDLQKNLIRKLQRQIKNEKKQENQPNKLIKTKKTVRFMLPGYSEPIVNGRIAFKEDLKYLFEDVHDDDDDDEVQFYLEVGNDNDDDDGDDEEEEGDDSDNKDVADVASDCGKNESDVEDFICRNEVTSDVTFENVDNPEAAPPAENGDYKLLMKEHLVLEQTVANICQSFPHNWSVEKESLQMDVMALEKKNQEYEMMMNTLRGKIEEMKEKNEELEFQVLEFEGSGNEALKKEQEIADFALIDRNHKLEEEIKSLQAQLLQGAARQTSRAGVECSSDTSHVEIQCDATAEEDVMEKECDQTSCSETAFTSSTSSGFDDLSSDDENSLDSMPHDEPRVVQENVASQPSNAKPPEECWAKHLETLEMKLACSKLRERQLQDRLALICEEKNRIIRDFDKYANSDGDSLIEFDSAIDEESVDDDSQAGDLRQKPRSSPAVSVGSSHLRLDFSMDFGKCAQNDDSFLIETPTSADLCFPKSVQSLTVEDETDVLHQRVCHLEKDCDLLREIIDMDEGIIHDLQIKVDELESSEKNLSRIVDRLENVEKVLRSSESAAVEENSRLKVELSRSRSVEENLQSQLNLMKCDESQLKHKLDEVLEELRQTESKLKRKTSDSDRDRKALTLTNEKLEDHVGELEAVVELLKRRNQNLQRLCEDTNTKLVSTENSCKRYKAHTECMEQQRDAFVARIQTMEKDKLIAIENFNLVGKNLSEKTNELEMARVEINGLRAYLDSSEREVEKWIKKAEDRADVEILLMKEMDDLRGENDCLEEQLRLKHVDVSTPTRRQKVIESHLCVETQTEPSVTIFVGECDANDVDEEDEETLMAIAEGDDDDDRDDVASMDDASEESELDREGFPLDYQRLEGLCHPCRKKLKVGGISKEKWGSLDSLWCKFGFKNNSFGNSQAFRDKFTQTLIPLVPYLKRMHATSLMRNKLDLCRPSVGASMIPLSTKYFGQSNSNSYTSRPPIRAVARVLLGHQDVKTEQSDNMNVVETSLDDVDIITPTPRFDLLPEYMSAIQNSSTTNSPSAGLVQDLQSPGPCASQ